MLYNPNWKAKEPPARTQVACDLLAIAKVIEQYGKSVCIIEAAQMTCGSEERRWIAAVNAAQSHFNAAIWRVWLTWPKEMIVNDLRRAAGKIIKPRRD